MDPVLLIGRYLYSRWVLGAHPGGIESYRPLPQLGVLSCDRGNLGGSPWLLRFVTAGLFFALLFSLNSRSGRDSSAVWLLSVGVLSNASKCFLTRCE